MWTCRCKRWLLEEAKRTTHYTEDELNRLDLARPLSLVELKRQWLAAVQRAETLLNLLPAREVGCLYLDAQGRPVTPDISSPEFAQLRPHFGSVRGAWPEIK